MAPLLSDPAELRPERRLAWHWFAFDLPHEWEVVGYSTNPRNGQMEFHTRHGFMGLLTWTTFRTRPDMRRVSRDLYMEVLASEKRKMGQPCAAVAQADPACDQAAGFYLLHSGEQAPCMAVTFIDEPRILLTWIFPRFDLDAAERYWLPLLESFQENVGAIREWAIFGLRLRVPAEFMLADISPEPGRTHITLENPEHLHVTMRRWAMPEYLLAGSDLSSFYCRVLRSLGADVVETRNRDYNGFSAVRVDFKRRGEYAMEKLSGRWWTGQGIIWHDLREKRLYSFEQVGRKSVKRLEMSRVVQS